MNTSHMQPPRDSKPTTATTAGGDTVPKSPEQCVSVVIPVYKAADFVERAAESALHEPEVLEVILIEDGSPDESLAVCKRLAERHGAIRVLQHPGGVNRGAGASRNLGIESAGGTFVAFLDADDYFLPGRFRADLTLLEDQPGLDGVYNAIGTEFYDDAGKARYVGKGQDESHLTTMKVRVEPEALFEAMAPVGTGGHFHADGLTVRRRLFDCLEGFDPEMELSQDTLLFLQMALKCRLGAGLLDQAVAMRGVHSENRVADEEKLRRFRGLLFRKLYSWMRREGLSADRVQRVWELYYHYASLAHAGPELKFLGRHLLKHPEVLSSRAFWRRVFRKLGR